MEPIRLGCCRSLRSYNREPGKRAAVNLLRGLLKRQGMAPRIIVTDKLRFYPTPSVTTPSTSRLYSPVETSDGQGGQSVDSLEVAEHKDCAAIRIDRGRTEFGKLLPNYALKQTG